MYENLPENENWLIQLWFRGYAVKEGLHWYVRRQKFYVYKKYILTISVV